MDGGDRRGTRAASSACGRGQRGLVRAVAGVLRPAEPVPVRKVQGKVGGGDLVVEVVVPDCVECGAGLGPLHHKADELLHARDERRHLVTSVSAWLELSRQGGMVELNWGKWRYFIA